MELIYVCKACGRENTIDAEELLASRELICPKCRFYSSLTTDQDAPKRWDETLNLEQEKAACYNGRANAVLVLAGAGCGKTKTLISRALYLHRELKVPAERIALLTFTRKAAKEISERLDSEIAGIGKRMFVGTFHRFCLDLMHHHLGYFGNRNCKLIDREDQSSIIRKLRNQLDLPEDAPSTLLPGADEICGIFSYINNCQVQIADYFKRFPAVHLDTPSLVEKIESLYLKYKAEKNLMDFDDVLSLTVSTLNNVSDFKRLVQNKFEHILVDEMQDTSPVQWAILNALYQPVQLFCVGDDAQSIYSFRGADFASVHHFCEKLPHSTTLKLTENYRSKQQILDIANLLLNGSKIPYDKDLHSHLGAAERGPELYTFHSDFDEADFIVQSIRSKLRNGVNSKDIMVLFRSAAHARVIEYTLRTAGISYRFVGGMSFLQSSHIKDAVSTLEALTNYRYDLAWYRFLQLHRKLGDKSAAKFVQAIQFAKENAAALHEMATNTEQRYPELANFVRDFDFERPPAKLLTDIVSYFERTGLLAEKYENWDDRKKDLQMLIRIAEKYSNTERFLEAFKLDPDAEVLEQSRDSGKLTLITVHSAKGTECDYCYLVKVQNGVYPHLKALTDDEVEEERRVLYVAMTRAKKQLILTRTNSDRSRFLTVEMVRKMEHWAQAKGW